MRPPKTDTPVNRADIQRRYQSTLQKYAGLEAVLEDPNIPPRSKALVSTQVAAMLCLTPLGIAHSPWYAFCAVAAITITCASFVYFEKSGSRAHRGTGPPKPRP